MNTSDLLSSANDNLLFVIQRPDIVMERGKGMWLTDTDGNSYLDFIGGWAVNALGHSPEILVKVLSEQAATLINASPAFLNKPLLEYAQLILSHSCMDRVFFMSTGAEANEGAIKLARKYGLSELGGATDIITTQNSFHGRTLLTMAATGKPHWENLFGSKITGFKKAEFNALESFEALVDSDTCAIMLEPVQGEGGVNVASQEFMEGLKALCERHKLLLIFDEIQTGMGRCGSLFAYEKFGVEPDIMTLGKGIGGGFPLSAMLVKERLNIFEPGDQGGTYTGQPLAMAVGKAILNELVAPGFLTSVNTVSEYIKERLLTLSEEYEISQVRGLGLLLAFDLEQSKGSDVVAACLKDGLIINSPRDTSIRLIPPLICSKQDVDTMLEILLSHVKSR